MRNSRPVLFAGNGLSFRGFAIAFGVVLLLAYGDLALGFRTLYYRDFGLFGYPLAFHHRASFWNGDIPFWNPYSGCGLPFLAQWNTLVLYPGSFVYLLLPLPWGLNLYGVLHMFWAGLGMYWLAWKWVGDRLGACVAGLAFGMGGLLINSLMWPNNIAAFSWMPWVVLAAEAACRQGGIRILHAAVLGTIQMLTGAPEIILLTWGMVGILILAWTLPRGGRTTGLTMLRVGAQIGLIIALATPQLVPFLELLMEHSHRTAQFDRGEWAIAPAGWANLILPLFRTTTNPGGVVFQSSQYWTNSFYPGVCAVFLTICAVRYRPDRRVVVLLSLAVLGFWLALGEKGFLLPLVEKVVVPLQMVRFPVKYIVLTGFAIPLLAAFGLREWLARTGSFRARMFAGGPVVLGMIVLIGILVVTAAQDPRPGEDWTATFHNGWSRAALLAALTVALALVGVQGRLVPAKVLVVGVVALSAIDHWTHEPNQNPTSEPRILAPLFASLDSPEDMHPIPRLGESRAMADDEATLRVFALELSDTQQDFLIARLALLGNINLVERIPVTQGFFSLYHREANFLRFLAAQFTNVVENPLFDLLGISQVTRPGGTDYEWTHRPTALPLLMLGQETRYLSQQETVNLLAEPNYEPDRIICLPESASGKLEVTDGAVGRVTEAQVTDHRIHAMVETDRPTLLRIAQSPYPHWRAAVDGKHTPILTADFAFQAVQIPTGRHRVVLWYRDTRFASALGLSWAVLATGVVGLLRSKKRPRTGPGSGL